MITDPIDCHIRWSLLNFRLIYACMSILSMYVLHKPTHKRHSTHLDCLIRKHESYSTRSISYIITIRARTTTFQKFFSVNYTFLWNSLHPYLRNLHKFCKIKLLVIAFCNSSLFTRHGLCSMNYSISENICSYLVASLSNIHYNKHA